MKRVAMCKCWGCGNIVSVNRIEKHHIYGKEKEETVSLCVICHDYVDRYTLDNERVFYQFTSVLKEISELPEIKTKFTRLLILKLCKLFGEKQDANSTTTIR